MIGILIGIVLFIITIPIKTTKLAITTSKGLRNISERVNSIKRRKQEESEVLESGDEQTKKDLEQQKSEEKKTRIIEKSKRFGKKAGKLAIKTAIKALKLLVLFLQWLGTLFFAFGLIGGLLMILIWYIVLSGVVYVAVLMDSNSSGSFSFAGNTPNTTETGGANASGNVATSGDVKASLDAMANWYITHVDTYQNDYHHPDSHNNPKCAGSEADAYYSANKDNSDKCKAKDGGLLYLCDLTNTWVRDDCTGFAAAYATLVSGEEIAKSDSSSMLSSWDATNHGWTKIDISTLSSIDDVKEGDILVCNGHAEIFISTSQCFGWGGIRSEHPLSKTWSFSSGHVNLQWDKRNYTTLYRYTGK